MDLKQLRGQLRRDLFDEFLPVMDRQVIDHWHGGFLCTPAQENDSWYVGRGAWVYAFLYRHFTHDPKHLDVARKAVELALRIRPRDDPRWPRRFTRTGETLAPDNEIYGSLFIAEGLSEYAAAAGQPEYGAIAEEIVRDCVALYDRPGYLPNTASYLGADAPPFPGARVQGVSMLLLRMAPAFADRAIVDLAERFYNPEHELNNELLNYDYTIPAGDYGRFFYTGHTLEAMWMLMDEAQRRGDTALFELAAKRFLRHVDVSRDPVEGGYIRGFLKGAPLPGKVLWEQEEVLIGTLLLNDFERFEGAWAWTREHLPWLTAYPNRIENYHHPRQLMLNLLALDKLIGS